MENASKALVMAGGVLIGVLILSLAVYLFVDFGTTSAEINEQNAQQQLVEFNSKFTAYQDYKDHDGNWNITIYDIITLKGYAKENNKYYEGQENEKIDVMICGTSILAISEQTLIERWYNSIINELIKFKCDSISYNNRGKVNKINFTWT